MKIFIDVNVFIDVMTKRSGWTESLRVLNNALAATGPDFEDNIQLASAEVISAIHLVTRNKKDFDASNITVVNPEEWLVLEEVATLEAKLT